MDVKQHVIGDCQNGLVVQANKKCEAVFVLPEHFRLHHFRIECFRQVVEVSEYGVDLIQRHSWYEDNACPMVNHSIGNANGAPILKSLSWGYEYFPALKLLV